MEIYKIWRNGKLVYDSTKGASVKPNNNAPKSIKGDYDLSIHGNKIVLVDNVDGTTVEAKCHPDDNFDIGIGIKEAFKKLNEKREEERRRKEEEDKKIKVGDWVKVEHRAVTYSRYATWLYDKTDFYYVRKFDYGNSPDNGVVGQVIAIGEHEKENVILVAFCTKDGKVYIIDIKGVRKVAKPQ